MADHPAPPSRHALPAHPAAFDEQLWPVNCVIIILAGVLVGIICAQSSFDPAETTFFQNGYVHLGIVGLLVGTLVWAVTWLQGKMVRRVQLCILFSLLVHLGLALYLHRQYLALVAAAERDEALEMAGLDERITVPDYPWHYPDQPRSPESFERPVDTETPEPPALEPVDREHTEEEATLDRPEPVEPETPEPEPETVELRRAELTPPERQAEDDRIRRQQWDNRPTPDERVAMPETPPAETNEPAPIRIESQRAAAQRQLALPEAPRQAPQAASLRSEWTALTSALRALALSEPEPALEAPAQPLSLARANTGVNLPSASMTVDDVTSPPAIGGAAPSTLELESAAAAVTRSDDLALKRANTGALGAAEFALGSSQVAAQLGQPRALGDSAPSVGPSDPVRRMARSPLGPAIPTTPSPEVADVPAVAAAFGGGGPATPPPDSRGTPVGPAGSVGVPRPARTSVAGSGPGDFRGASGPIEVAQLTRVTGEGTAPAAQVGGGTPMPARRMGRAYASDARVEIPPLASGPPTGGAVAGPLLEAQPSGRQLPVAGLPGSLISRPSPGAIEALASVGPQLPSDVARRTVAGQETPGRVGLSPANSATLAKASTGPRLPAAAVRLENVPIPGAAGMTPSQGGEPSVLDVSPNRAPSPPSPEAGQGGPLVTRAGAGPVLPPAGLSVRPAGGPQLGDSTAQPVAALGPPGRQADSAGEVALRVPRAPVSKRSGAPPLIDAQVGVPMEAFQQREPDRRSETARQHGATEGSEKAVEAGLDFLARHQFPNGHWSLNELPRGNQGTYADAGLGHMDADTAATGLALLAFLGAGYTHMDNKHQDVVQKGIAWLIADQQPNGQLFTIPTDGERPARSYGHAIASIALCEAYGMTRDSRLREPARRAIQYILDAQHPTLGGWRYTKRDDEAVWQKESDTSVSGWMLMALKSAQMAGLEVPPHAMQRVGDWLDLAQSAGGSQYRYNPYAANTPEQRQGRRPNLAMTAEGLLMRMYLGWDRTTPAMISGADHLRQNLPELSARDPLPRDVYYWYYATQVMFQMQGEHWKAWNDRLRPLLEESQVRTGPLAGSWDPNRPVPDRWSEAGGRLYVTTLNLLMLEVYYRYLPLFKTLVEDGEASGG